MLPRVATTTGASQPSPAPQGGTPVDTATKPQLSATALANLRAEVLFRLIETLLKHMPRVGEPNPNRTLLETLLAVLKSLPGREAENGHKLADLIAKLPPELRPSVEKLIGTVLSSMPTRTLVEIVRNPNGPEAQKLATLLATSLPLSDDGDVHATGAERQQRPLALTAQQLAAVGRHGTQQTVQAAQMLGADARVLQTSLKRVFDLDGGAKPRTLETPAGGRHELAGPNRLAAASGIIAHAEPRLPLPIAKLGDQPPVEASATAIRHKGDAEDIQTATPAGKREETPARGQVVNAVGQALARSVLQAVAREVPPAMLMQAVAHLVASLSPEEANFLRALLERPLEPMVVQDTDVADIDLSLPGDFTPEMPEGDAAIPTDLAIELDGVAELDVPTKGEAEAGAEAMTDVEGTAEIDTIADAETTDGGRPAEPVRTRAEATQTASIPPRQLAELEEPQAAARVADASRPTLLADGTPDVGLPAAILREGVPVAFVPYLSTEDDLDWPEPQEAEKDETTDEDETEGESGDREGEEADAGSSEGEPEAADMARRREKTAEMVGVIEPGLAFYQKLGNYWT